MAFEKGPHDRHGILPFDALDTRPHDRAPVVRIRDGSAPPHLFEPGIEQAQIGRRPGPVRQVPDQVEKVAPLHVRAAVSVLMAITLAEELVNMAGPMLGNVGLRPTSAGESGLRRDRSAFGKADKSVFNGACDGAGSIRFF